MKRTWRDRIDHFRRSWREDLCRWLARKTPPKVRYWIVNNAVLDYSDQQTCNAPQPSPIGSIPVSDCGCPRSDTPWHKDGRCYCPKCNPPEDDENAQ